MCGIVGWWQRDGGRIDSDLLTEMRDKLVTRGPDDAGIWIEDAMGFGHRRLSILDLSTFGHQPMVDKDTGLVIVHNGEVYNFCQIKKELESKGLKFNSETDTEVILKAYGVWGPDCLQKFLGMFAFAIWDPRKKTLFIARDRIGIKPLYYQITDSAVLFASRLSSILIHPECKKDIDKVALGLYLEIGFVPAPWSILKGVRKLKPGHFIYIKGREVTERCYWDIGAINIDHSLTKARETELVERLDLLLRDSVKLHLISDVPLGAFLSGGIDSSLVVALMAQLSNNPPKTFTIGFEEQEYDESRYASGVSDFLGTEHHQMKMSSSDLISLLDDNTRNYDEPYADWSSLPTMMVSRFARRQVTVCLSGDGGDELFAGYHYYSILAKLKYSYQSPRLIRSMVGNVINSAKVHSLTLLGESMLKKDILGAFSFMRTMIKDYGRENIFSENTLTIENLFNERCRSFVPLDDISKACRIDCCYYLPDDILQKVDVASMAYGLEARVPLLDHRIIEFSQSLPIDRKLNGRQTKLLLKRVLEKYLPKRLFDRPKRGFSVPIKEWFRKELKELLLEELSPERIKDFGYLDYKGVKKLIDLHFTGKRDTHPMLWALLSLLRWNSNIRQIS